MSSYSELIKNFEKIRAYMRDFYVYGFKSREAYREKSARSYDDERRRIASWLGNYLRFVRTPEGKTVLISIDTRTVARNPLYQAWRAKSFTDGDVILHFILFDILCEPSVRRTVSELSAEIDERYLSNFAAPMLFDESTIRKKLGEYAALGLVTAERDGRRVYYRRTDGVPERGLRDALHYFSEVAPCGVIGSFLLDRLPTAESGLTFKHHYLTAALDSDVLTELFVAMREARAVTVTNLSRRRGEPRRIRIVPLRVLISVQNGRQHLMAYLPEFDRFRAYRIDYLSEVKQEGSTSRFSELRAELDRLQAQTWGVSVGQDRTRSATLQRVEFTVLVEEYEDFIVKRLEREKRVGTVERIDRTHYRFSAEVTDSSELLPWIRTFICRIVQLHISDRNVEARFKRDLAATYRLYGIKKEGET